MLAAAEAAGVVHLLGTEFRLDGPMALLGRLVADGVAGMQVLDAIRRSAAGMRWVEIE